MLDLNHLQVVYRSRTATHICFVLPNREYVVNIYMSEHRVHAYVYHDVSNKQMVDFAIDKKKSPHWEDLLHQFCELAVKKFPKEVRYRR